MMIDPAYWVLVAWLVLTPAKTDVVEMKEIGQFQHPTRAECFQWAGTLERLTTSPAPELRRLYVDDVERQRHGPLPRDKAAALVDKMLRGFKGQALPELHVSPVTPEGVQAMCFEFDPGRYRRS